MHVPAEPTYIGKWVKLSSLRKTTAERCYIWQLILVFGVGDSGVEATVASWRMYVLSKEGISDGSTVTWEHPQVARSSGFSERSQKSWCCGNPLHHTHSIVMYILAMTAMNKKLRGTDPLSRPDNQNKTAINILHEINRQYRKKFSFSLTLWIFQNHQTSSFVLKERQNSILTKTQNFVRKVIRLSK